MKANAVKRKRWKITLIVVTIVSLLILSTRYFFTFTGVTVNTVTKATLPQSRKSISYRNFWEAMKNVDLDYLRIKQEDLDYAHFSAAIQLVIEGDFDSAEEMFNQLYIYTKKPLIKNHSKEILSSLLFSQSKWTEILDINFESSETLDIENNNIILVEAFSKSPKEIYSFPSHPTVIPMTMSLARSPIIEVEINGYRKRFWLDTGSSLSVVTSDIIKECSIPPIFTARSKASTGTNKTVYIQLAIIEKLKLGDIYIKNHPTIIIDKRDLEFELFGLFKIIKIDGIIGWNAIKNIDIEIDYKHKKVIANKPRKIHFSKRNLFWLGYPIVVLTNQANALRAA